MSRKSDKDMEDYWEKDWEDYWNRNNLVTDKTYVRGHRNTYISVPTKAFGKFDKKEDSDLRIVFVKNYLKNSIMFSEQQTEKKLCSSGNFLLKTD